MSETIATIKNTGRMNTDLDITRFYGGDQYGVMWQLTQGCGMSLDEPGFIQLTVNDVKRLITILKTIEDSDENSR